ncbi:MAG: porin [Elusimicrobia bacterium]|nr:porin [Elusimicrobiota bacterium]
MKRSTISKTILSAALLATIAAGVRAEGPTVSGFVDMGYNYNLNGANTNVLRSFDANANSFILQNAEVVVNGSNDKGVAYRVDVDFGNDAGVQNGLDGFAATTTYVNLQQAFLSLPCPLTHGTITVGKFVTPFGAEVIESKDNYNTSRGHLFNFAIPATHTGVKLDKGLKDGKLNLMAGIVNSWDLMQDNNKGKTVIAQASLVPTEKLSVTVGGSYGPDQATTTPSIEKNGRSLVDAIVKFTPTNKLTLLANYDWGVEEGVGPSIDNTAANWSGLALYGNLAFTDATSAALRWETFDDEGARTGTEQVLNSITATLQQKYNGVILRAEYRMDKSTQKVYVDSDGLADDTQNTVGINAIYAF